MPAAWSLEPLPQTEKSEEIGLNTLIVLFILSFSFVVLLNGFLNSPTLSAPWTVRTFGISRSS